MPSPASPLRFQPFLRPMVWGGRRLETLLGKLLPTAGNYGESWEISDHPDHRTPVIQGPHAGRTLSGMLRDPQFQLLRQPADGFPWLVKFLDARDWLSVQVHPDDDAVSTLWPGEQGKTEAWFILAAEPGSRIYAGLLPGIGPKEFHKALEQGRILQVLHSFQPQPGDCVFLPAGTVHAVGGGVVLAEIQQTSDATFRLFDWNRLDSQGKPRQLHIREGLQAIHWDHGPVEPRRVPQFQQPLTGSLAQPLVDCPYFRLSWMGHGRPFTLGGLGVMQVVIVVAGQGRVNQESLTLGQVLLLPASLPAMTFIPEPFLSMVVATERK